MSLPDIDYELSKDMGQFEYAVSLADASSPKDMEFVAGAFRAGQDKEQQRILYALEALADKNGYLQITLFELRKIINND